MKSWRIADGRLHAGASVGAEDRGFRYGMSFFESVAVASGHALFLEEHLELLRSSAATEGAALDCGLIASLIGKLVAELPDGLLRIYASAGPGDISAPFAGLLHLLFQPCTLGPGLPVMRVILSKAVHCPRPGGMKTANYWPHVDAMREAAAAGCDEALLFNACGHLVSSAMGNVFLKSGGCWLTPCHEAGARKGVVRDWVLRCGFATEALLTSEDIVRAESCIVTNSRVGVREVAELDGRALSVDESWSQAYRGEILRS